MFDGDLLKERARVTPGRLALVVVATGERLTYAGLDARAERAAAALLRHAEPGDRIGLLAANGLPFLDVFFGALRAGLIAVPLSTRATAHELQHIAHDCGMKLLVYGPEFADVAAGVDVPRTGLGFLEDADVGGSLAGVVRRSDDEVCCLLYTSGTTGRPKGVMIPRRQLWWNGYNTAVNWGLREDDVTQVFTPLYHAGGLAVFMIPLFATGGTVVLHRGFDAREVWSTLEKERATVVFGVPTTWKMLMDAPEFESADLSSVRWFISGGAPLPHYLIEAYQKRGVVFKQGYGMTEVGVNCFTMDVGDSFRRPGSIGRPMLFTEIRIVGEDGSDLPPGEIGEMWIRGPHVSSGYWNNARATGEAYLPGGWFRTGDLAKRDDEGFFYVAGRLKEMFISGGVNVYPAEIEAALVSHPAVSDAAVVAVPDETWGEAGVAFVVAPGLGTDAITAHLASRISKVKIPKRFVFVDSLPRTPYGKVVKRELVERAVAQRAAEGDGA